MNDDLKIIKKNYGENFAHLCRELFPSLLEKEGLLPKILLSNIYPTRSLYDDIINNYYQEDFKNYIYSFIDVEIKDVEIRKTVKDLLSEAGYNFYECHSEEDIQAFKKYYAKGEELCTFNGNRLNRCHVFWAIKKDVDNIKREDYSHPTRQDKYGTSVISIQFTKGKTNTLSIKNRYNHRVNNPDATFSNNLENIIPGLTKAFEKEYQLNINQIEKDDFELTNYVLGNDKKLYRYNYEIDNIYYCENNVIVANGEVIELDKSRYLLIDYFIIDLKEKRITTFNNEIRDDFINHFNKIDKIEIINDKETETKNIIIKDNNKKDIFIKIDKYGCIVELKDENVKKIGNNFLIRNKTLKKIELPLVEEIGDSFLCLNNNLDDIHFPNLKKVGDEFLRKNMIIKKIYLPNLEEIKANFIAENQIINEAYLPKLKKVGYAFLNYNKGIEQINLPNLEEVKDEFLYFNNEIKNVYLPKLRKAGKNFLGSNFELEELNLPNLEEVDDYFVVFNQKIKKMYLPKLKIIGNDFLRENRCLEEINLPSTEKIANHFLYSSTSIKKVYLPNLKQVEDYFLNSCHDLKEVILPKLKEVGDKFLNHNNLKKLSLPCLKKSGDEFLYYSSIPEKNELDFINTIEEVGDNTHEFIEQAAAINKGGTQNEKIDNNKHR